MACLFHLKCGTCFLCKLRLPVDTFPVVCLCFNTTPPTVQTVRTAFDEFGLDGALYRKKRETPPVQPKIDGNLEAHIISICCSKPPEGYERWTLRLVADKCVELGYIDSISHMTVKRTLKKTNLNLI